MRDAMQPFSEVTSSRENVATNVGNQHCGPASIIGFVCPVCGGTLEDIKLKRICTRCRTIVETCCEGGRG